MRRIAFVYIGNVYLSEIDLYRAEGVTAAEAYPCKLPVRLPATVWRVNGGDLVWNWRRALDAFTAEGGCLDAFSLRSDQRGYTRTMVLASSEDELDYIAQRPDPFERLTGTRA